MTKECHLLLQHFGANCLLLDKWAYPDGTCCLRHTNLVYTICEILSSIRKRSFNTDTTAFKDFLSKRTSYKEMGIVCECCYQRHC
ncbi:hypothetical protein ACJMK2_028034 [Sinanodonta woodiana]|uniref:Uncharacterized protein n=1 Tax=Sinanodonta woodiana TaxID=1069815 RepID=A0ABD3X9D2_SINWO